MTKALRSSRARKAFAGETAGVCPEDFEALNALAQVVRMDPAMNSNDVEVTSVLIAEMLKMRNKVAALPYPDISKRSGLSVYAARYSLKKLQRAGYFRVIQPTRAELNEGGWCLKYQAQVERYCASIEPALVPVPDKLSQSAIHAVNAKS